MKYIAYTDGSYGERNNKKAYGSASIFRESSGTSWQCLKSLGSDEQLLPYRNVAGEILAVTTLCNYLMTKVPKCTDLEINYDYIGIENWVTGAWKAKKELTATYRNYMRDVVMKRINIVFNHTTGHSGIAGNERVDSIVNKIVQDYLNE